LQSFIPWANSPLVEKIHGLIFNKKVVHVTTNNVASCQLVRARVTCMKNIMLCNFCYTSVFWIFDSQCSHSKYSILPIICVDYLVFGLSMHLLQLSQPQGAPIKCAQHANPSVCTYQEPWELPDGFSRNLIFEHLTKNCLAISILV
jgi:hypothetical protein